MAFNGTGTFVINTAGQPVVTGTVISSSTFNALTADLATGLSTTITKDGQSTPTNNIPFGGYKITGLGAPTTNGDALSWGNPASFSTLNIGVATGTSLALGGATLGSNTLAVAGGFSFLNLSGSANPGGFSATRSGPVAWGFSNPDTSGSAASNIRLSAGSTKTAELLLEDAANRFTITAYSGADIQVGTSGGGDAIFYSSGSTTISGNDGITLSSATTLSNALTYGGVTLDNSVTGTGSMVLNTDPFFEGVVTVGDAGVVNSVDPAVVVSRNVDSSGSGNGHCFSDSSQLNRPGGIAYNSFDARIDITGSEDYDHYAAFQAIPAMQGSGTIDKCYGVASQVTINSGAITNAYGYYAFAPNGSGTAGVVNKYAFVSELDAGNVGIGTTTPTEKFVVYENYPDGAAKSVVLNDNGGTAAQAAFLARNGTCFGVLGMLGTGYSTTGFQRNNGMYLFTDGTGGMTFNTGTANPIYWYTNNAYCGQVSGTGNFLWNTTSDGGWSGNGKAVFLGGTSQQSISVQNTGTNASSSAILARIDDTAANLGLFYYNTTMVGNITTNGTITIYGTTSDGRLKKNIEDAGEAGAIIDALRVRSYEWKSNGSREDFGFIAQETAEVYPLAVAIGDSGETVERPWSRDDSKLVPLLVKELQSLRARVAALEAI